MADVRLNIKPLQQLVEAVDKAGEAASTEPLGAMFIQWGARYMTFTRRRFNRLSAGSGGWRPLKSQTGRRRKKARRSARGKARRHSILVETGTLRNALSTGMPGNLSERLRTPAGIRVGFSTDAHNGDGLTIRQLAVIHDQGLGNVPQRTILVRPDAKTVRGMMSDSERATQRLMASLELKGDIG